MAVTAVVPKHFEMKGREEPKIVARPRILALLPALLSLGTLTLG
jgi:hypothetical protein